MVIRPAKDEYLSYYLKYVNLVPEGEIISILSNQIEKTMLMFKNFSEEQGKFRYESGKWSLKEVLGHLIDTERIMSYRLLSIARGETVSFPGFNEEMYVAHASFNEVSMEQLLTHFTVVRQSTILLLQSLDEQSWIRKGLVNNGDVTVRALAYIIAGHELHHRRIVKERYINSDEFPTLN